MASCGAAERQNDGMTSILASVEKGNSDSDFEDLKTVFKKSPKSVKPSASLFTDSDDAIKEAKPRKQKTSDEMDKLTQRNVLNVVSQPSKIKLSDVETWTVHCSACGKQVNHHDVGKVKKHRHLGVLVCQKCYKFYGDGDFTKDETGSDEYCRWCAQGGNLLLCDNCEKAFCKNCIRRNFGRKTLAAIIENKHWACFMCDPSPLTDKINHCNSVLKYCEGQKENSQRQYSTDLDNNDNIAPSLVPHWLKVCSLADGFRKTVLRLKSSGHLRNKDEGAQLLIEKINQHTALFQSAVKEIKAQSNPLNNNVDQNNISQKPILETPLVKKPRFKSVARALDFVTTVDNGNSSRSSETKLLIDKALPHAVKSKGSGSTAREKSSKARKSKRSRSFQRIVDSDSEADSSSSVASENESSQSQSLLASKTGGVIGHGETEGASFATVSSSHPNANKVSDNTEGLCSMNDLTADEPNEDSVSTTGIKSTNEKQEMDEAIANEITSELSDGSNESDVHPFIPLEAAASDQIQTCQLEKNNRCYSASQASLFSREDVPTSMGDVENDDARENGNSKENIANPSLLTEPKVVLNRVEIGLSPTTINDKPETSDQREALATRLKSDSSLKEEDHAEFVGDDGSDKKNIHKNDGDSEDENSQESADSRSLLVDPSNLLDHLEVGPSPTTVNDVSKTSDKREDPPTTSDSDDSLEENKTHSTAADDVKEDRSDSDSTLPFLPSPKNGGKASELKASVSSMSLTLAFDNGNKAGSGEESKPNAKDDSFRPMSPFIDNEKAKQLLIKDSPTCHSDSESNSESSTSISTPLSFQKKKKLKKHKWKENKSLKSFSKSSSLSDLFSSEIDSEDEQFLCKDKKLQMQTKVVVSKLSSHKVIANLKSHSRNNSCPVDSDEELKKFCRRMLATPSGTSSSGESSPEDSDASSKRKEKDGLDGACKRPDANGEDEELSHNKTDGKKAKKVLNSTSDVKNGLKESSSKDKSALESSSSTDEDALDSAPDSKEDLIDTDGKVKIDETSDEKTGNDMAKEYLLKDALSSSADEDDEKSGTTFPEDSKTQTKGDKSKKNEESENNDEAKSSAEESEEENSSTEESDSDKSKSGKKSQPKGSDYEDKSQGSTPESENTSDSDFIVPKKKLKIKDKLLTTPLTEKEKKAEVDEEEKKKDKGGKQGKKKRKVVISDDDDSKEKVINLSSSSDTEESSSDKEKKSSKKKQGKKRKRIKVADSSEENSSDGDKKDGANKGRKNIRKLISDSRLKDETKAAARAEEERRRRVAERQKLYNDVTQIEIEEAGKVKKLVLEIDPKTKQELVEVHPDLASKLKPHQVNGVRFMWDATVESIEQLKKKSSTGCILAHSMGLGKTLQVITYLHTVLTNIYTRKYIKTALVICPYNTVLNWANEFNDWLNTDELRLEVYELSTIKENHQRARYIKNWQEEGGVLIIGYNMFRMLADEKRKRVSKKLKESFYASLIDPGPDVVVCDEGHLLKNEASALSKAVSKIKSLRRIVLTGTPLQNNLKEYHCMVHFVKPHLLGTRKEFQNRFVNPIMNGQCADSTPTDFKLMKKRVHILHKLLEGCVQRCDYSVLTPYLPPKHEYIVSIRLSENQVKLYLHYLENCSRGRSEAGTTVGVSLFKDYTVLKDIWTHPYLLFLSMTRKSMEEYDSLEDFIDDSSSESEEDVVCLNEDEGKKSPRRGTRSTRRKSEAGDEEEEEGNNSGEGGEEVVKKWKTRRTRGEIGESSKAGEAEEEEERETTWWNEFVTEKDETNIEMSGKLVVLFSILRECELIGDKLLLFSQSLPTLNLVEKMLCYITEQTRNSAGYDPQDYLGIWVPGVDYFRMDGSTNVDLRRRCIEAFNDENDRARLFMISTKAGSLGTNLVGANRVVILDASWNPTHDIQAIFRVFRFGQQKPVYVYRLLAQGTMEEKIYDRQVNKQSLSCRVIDEQQIERHFNASDLQELYTFDPDSHTKRPTPMVPKDRLLAEMLIRHKEWIVTYHEHDSLLQNMPEEDLTEEERKAAWAEYEAEKEGLMQRASVFDMYNEMANMQMGQRVNIDLAKIIENIKTQKPDVTPSELNNYLYNALVMLRSEYQQYQMNLLRQKNQMVSEGKPVPSLLLQQLLQMGGVIYEVGRIMQELRTGIPANASMAQQVHQQQFNRRGRPPTSLGIPMPNFSAAMGGANATPTYRMAPPQGPTNNTNSFQQQSAFLQNLANMRHAHLQNQNHMGAGTSHGNWAPPRWQYPAQMGANNSYYGRQTFTRNDPIITEVNDDEPSASHTATTTANSGVASNRSSSVVIQEVE